MDINAGKILRLEASVDEVGDEIYRKVLDVASGTAKLLREPRTPGIRAHLQVV